MLTRKQIQARDRRHAAIHEAGHLAVAASFGLYPTSAWIAPSDGADSENERLWHGRVQFLTLDRLDALQRRMVGCAGAVAELSWCREDIEPSAWAELDLMSPSDWKLCGVAQLDDLCVEALERLQYLLDPDGGPLWPDLIVESRRLIVESRQLL